MGIAARRLPLCDVPWLNSLGPDYIYCTVPWLISLGPCALLLLLFLSDVYYFLMSTSAIGVTWMGTGSISERMMGFINLNVFAMSTGGHLLNIPMGTAYLLEVVGTRFHLGTGDCT